MPKFPADGLLPYIYMLPVELIPDKVSVKEALNKIYGDTFFMVVEINGSFRISSTAPGPPNLQTRLQDMGVMKAWKDVEQNENAKKDEEQKVL